MDKNDLKKNRQDWVASVAKSVAGIVPFAGGALGEIVGSAIPNQRFDRTVAYIEKLGQRIDALESNIQKRLQTDPIAIDLIERGGQSAVKALTDERIDKITEIVANGLSKDETRAILQKRLLALLDDLDDLQIQSLPLYIENLPSAKVWEMRKQRGLIPPSVEIGTSEEIVSPRLLRDLGMRHLERIGLIDKHIKQDSDGNTRMFLRTGETDYTPVLSKLGHMLLGEIGYWDTDPDCLIKEKYVMVATAKFPT
ncbi:MAG: hypothetical protein V3U57_00285 [Robiginitomaculum sp.]